MNTNSFGIEQAIKYLNSSVKLEVLSDNGEFWIKMENYQFPPKFEDLNKLTFRKEETYKSLFKSFSNVGEAIAKPVGASQFLEYEKAVVLEFDYGGEDFRPKYITIDNSTNHKIGYFYTEEHAEKWGNYLISLSGLDDEKS